MQLRTLALWSDFAVLRENCEACLCSGALCGLGLRAARCLGLCVSAMQERKAPGAKAPPAAAGGVDEDGLPCEGQPDPNEEMAAVRPAPFPRLTSDSPTFRTSCSFPTFLLFPPLHLSNPIIILRYRTGNLRGLRVFWILFQYIFT